MAGDVAVRSSITKRRCDEIGVTTAQPQTELATLDQASPETGRLKCQISPDVVHIPPSPGTIRSCQIGHLDRGCTKPGCDAGFFRQFQ